MDASRLHISLPWYVGCFFCVSADVVRWIDGSIVPTRKVREVKKLDSDMQMLVYENYNKFISATDTIRKMAQNVEGMETEMADLKSSMDPISESSAKINASLKGTCRWPSLPHIRTLVRALARSHICLIVGIVHDLYHHHCLE